MPLSRIELRGIRARLGTSNDDFAALIGVNPRTVRDWVKGTPMRPHIETELRALLRQQEWWADRLTAGIPDGDPVVLPVDTPHRPAGWWDGVAGIILTRDPSRRIIATHEQDEVRTLLPIVLELPDDELEEAAADAIRRADQHTPADPSPLARRIHAQLTTLDEPHDTVLFGPAGDLLSVGPSMETDVILGYTYTYPSHASLEHIERWLLHQAIDREQRRRDNVDGPRDRDYI